MDYPWEGGFGQVCRGRWGSVEVAIKRLHLKSLTERTEEALIGEAKTMAALRHPNVIRFYGLCMEPGRYSIVMECSPSKVRCDLLHSRSELPWKIRYSIADGLARDFNIYMTKRLFIET